MRRQEIEAYDQYIKGILLIGFGMLLFKLLVTGDIMTFIAPRMHVFMYFTLIVSLLLGSVQVWRSAEKHDSGCACCVRHTKYRPAVYVLFLFPIVSGFVFSDVVIDEKVAMKRGVTLAGEVDETLNNLLSDAEEEALIQEPPPEYYEKLEDELHRAGHITVDDERYISIMDVIGKDVIGFKGKTMTLRGFVHREPSLGDREMIVARYGITCCTADASVLGMLATGEGVSSLEDGQWIEITGVLDETVFIDTLLPILSVQSITTIEPPVTQYVYQNFQK